MRSVACLLTAGLTVLVSVVSCGLPARAGSSDTVTATPIRHFIFLMQGDRTFDNYFGTYPGADGIPDKTCQALVLNRPQSGCVEPFALHGVTPPSLAPGRQVIDAQIDGGMLD